MRLKSTVLRVALLLLALAWMSGRAEAQTAEETPPPPPKYRLELVRIAETYPREYVFVINGAVGFKTVEALKTFVAGLPRGSVIEWAPGCRRSGDEPLLSSEAELEAFGSFCRERGIDFVLIPSG